MVPAAVTPACVHVFQHPGTSSPQKIPEPSPYCHFSTHHSQQIWHNNSSPTTRDMASSDYTGCTWFRWSSRSHTHRPAQRAYHTIGCSRQSVTSLENTSMIPIVEQRATGSYSGHRRRHHHRDDDRMIEALPLSLQAYTHTSTPEDKSTLIRLLFPVFQCVGFSDSILVLLREAATLGTGEAQLWSQLHSMDSRLRAGEQPVDEIMQLQAAAAQQGMTPLEAEIGIVLGIAHRDRGEIALSMTCLASAHMLAETTGQHTLIGRALIERAATLRGSGKHEIALRVLQTAHGHARRAKNIRLELIIAGSIGANERQLGHQLEAEASLRCALGIAQQLQSQENVAHISCNLANILVMDGRYAEAERLLTRSLTWYRTHGVLRSEGYVLQSIALAHMGRKQFRVAGCRTVEAMAAFRDAGNDMGTAYSTGMLGRILHATGDAPGALLRYHTAADGLARCNMPWLSGQFQALGAVAAADAGDWNTATELQQSAQTQLGDTSKAKALMAFVLSSFDAVKSGEAESVRQRIGSPRLDGDVLW